MKKLKRLLSNKKPVVVFIYGAPAVGKLTIAKILKKRLGYKLPHRHYINDFVEKIFTRYSFYSHKTRESVRDTLFQNMVKANISFITTHVYRAGFFSQTGLSDLKYMKSLSKKLEKLGAKFYAVHLKANRKELLRRVSMSSRKSFRKLRNKKIMKEQYLSNPGWWDSPKLKNNLVIDNTKISPKKVADMIIEHFNL